MYLVKAPRILKKLYPKELIWSKKSKDTVYISFDDGPHPYATPFVLSQLKKHNAQATFFCIGKNVQEHQEIYQQILVEGHQVGNHTQNHLNAWKVNSRFYIQNIREAEAFIQSKLFRPPYGKIKKRQAFDIQKLGFKIIMWDLLSGDFDINLSPEKCWKNIEKNIEPGSIIVFHDSTKAWERLKYVLPKTLDFCSNKKWKFGII